MNLDTNLMKIGGELRKLRTIEYLNINGMGAAILSFFNEVSKILKIIL